MPTKAATSSRSKLLLVADEGGNQQPLEVASGLLLYLRKRARPERGRRGKFLIGRQGGAGGHAGSIDGCGHCGSLLARSWPVGRAIRITEGRGRREYAYVTVAYATVG